MKKTTTLLGGFALVALAVTMLVPGWAASAIEAEAGPCGPGAPYLCKIYPAGELKSGTVGRFGFGCVIDSAPYYKTCGDCCQELANQGCDIILTQGGPCAGECGSDASPIYCY